MAPVFAGNGPCGSCNNDGDCQNPLMCRPLHSNYSANGCQCLPPYYYDTCGACVKGKAVFFVAVCHKLICYVLLPIRLIFRHQIIKSVDFFSKVLGSTNTP